MILNHETQRSQIQKAVNEYFGRRIDISPRAMVALQGRWCESDSDMELPDFIPSKSVFESLLYSSPGCFLLLTQFGISAEHLFSKGYKESPAPILLSTLEMIFEGNPETYFCDGLCKTGEAIIEKGVLTEIDLFSAFLETAYVGPKFFFENVESRTISKYCTDVGDLLLESASLGPSQIIEPGDNGWNIDVEAELIDEYNITLYKNNIDHYVARSLAEKYFSNLRDQITKIILADPSHDKFQFALWLDNKSNIRITPFGVGNLCFIEGSPPKFGESFTYREGIFQPISTIFHRFSDEAVFLLEDLMNSSKADEKDFQNFFEQYPEFLTGLEYKAVHPQIVLFNREGPNLIPDFMLEPMASPFCDLLEIKLPYQSLVKRLRNKSRVHFRSLVNEAISQLMEYKVYFESRTNRKTFHDLYGLEAYNPKTILVIGRKHHFKDDFERKQLKSLLPKDLEIWTYDDLLSRAQLYRKSTSL